MVLYITVYSCFEQAFNFRRILSAGESPHQLWYYCLGVHVFGVDDLVEGKQLADFVNVEIDTFFQALRGDNYGQAGIGELPDLGRQIQNAGGDSADTIPFNNNALYLFSEIIEYGWIEAGKELDDDDIVLNLPAHFQGRRIVFGFLYVRS